MASLLDRGGTGGCKKVMQSKTCEQWVLKRKITSGICICANGHLGVIECCYSRLWSSWLLGRLGSTKKSGTSWQCYLKFTSHIRNGKCKLHLPFMCLLWQISRWFMLQASLIIEAEDRVSTNKELCPDKYQLIADAEYCLWIQCTTKMWFCHPVGLREG